MRTTKSTSLPELKVKLNKYDNFFTKKMNTQQLAMEEEVPEIEDTQSQMIFKAHNRAHARNLEVINHKSTLKSKVESFLTDSRKMGILDHANTSNRRSLTKISLESMKPVKSEIEQQLVYLAKIKSQLNLYTENNRRTEKQIKNKKATIGQVRQKNHLFEQLLSRSWQPQQKLLSQRQENIIYIRFETDKLRHMQERLKQINITMKKRVKDAQNKLKKSDVGAKIMNQIEGIRQAKLDGKQYLLKHYDEFQFHKSENMLYKTEKAIKNMSENQASLILEKKQQKVHIIDRNDYQYQMIEDEHDRLMRELLAHKYYSTMLESTWTRYSSYYESYEKAEQLIKMNCMDRTQLVQDSYRKSFEVRTELQEKIKGKEDELKRIEVRNKQLKGKTVNFCYSQIEEIEQRLNNMIVQHKSDKKILKNAEDEEKKKYQKYMSQRQDEVNRSQQIMVHLKQWIIKCQQNLQLQISKRLPLSDHFKILIDQVHKQLGAQESTYELKKTTVSKPTWNKGISKNTNLRKRK